MRPVRATVALCLALALVSGVAAYDLAENDGDDVPGDAPILIGWNASRFPIPIGLDPAQPDNVSFAEFQAAVNAGFQAWNNASQGTVSFTEVGFPVAPASGEACSPPAGCSQAIIVERADWSGRTLAMAGASASNDTLALTLLAFQVASRDIVDADMLVNEQHQDFDTDGNVARFDLQGVMTHEIGHILGLAHPGSATRQTSTMWPNTLMPGTHLRTLENDDANGVQYLYLPLNIPVVPPDNNTIGLLARALVAAAGGGGGGGGCSSVPGFPVEGAYPLLTVLVGLLGLSRRRRG